MSIPEIREQVEFDADKYHGLRRAYATAVDDNQDRFLFEGNEYATSYAKYLLEYLTTKFEKETESGA